ncbi:MAG: FHA domain-containing protein [Planctomycetaceae bacterium]|nr:FHA domain-containing protein [Planctomycetaceae bacterium]
MYGFLTPTGGGDPFPLTRKELIIGRHRSCDIVLNFSNVSSKHCKLVLSEGYWYVIDLKSTNGVKVNGNRTQDRRIDPGALLTVSKHNFKINYDPRANGATGLPPSDMLREDKILTTSLMQRAGLERAKPQDTVVDEQLDIKSGDQPAASDDVELDTQQLHPPRDFFSDLKFD